MAFYITHYECEICLGYYNEWNFFLIYRKNYVLLISKE